jgi:hypothetical protein
LKKRYKEADGKGGKEKTKENHEKEVGKEKRPSQVMQ